MPRPKGLKDLEREYALLLGRYETAEIATETIVGLAALEAADRKITAEKVRLRDQMDGIAHTIRTQLNSRWQPYHIRALVPSRQKRGNIAKAAYQALKKAGRPLTATEIAKLIAPPYGVSAEDTRAIAKLHAQITASLEKWVKEGRIQVTRQKPALWSLRAPVWQPPHAADVFASVPLVRASRSTEATTSGAAASTPSVQHQGARWRLA